MTNHLNLYPSVYSYNLHRCRLVCVGLRIYHISNESQFYWRTCGWTWLDRKRNRGYCNNDIGHGRWVSL